MKIRYQNFIHKTNPNCTRNYKSFVLMIIGMTFMVAFLSAFQVPSFANIPLPIEPSFFTTSPSKFTFDECEPELSYDIPFSVEMVTSDIQWALYVALNPINKEIQFSENFYILSSSLHQESSLTSNKPFLLIEGTQPVLTQSQVGEFVFRFKPDWSIPAGQYQFELLFAYQNDFKQSPYPLPYKIPIQVNVNPTVILNLKTQPQPNLEFVIQGQPGFHTSETQLILNGKANVKSLSILCWVDNLKGKKGQTIPSSRVYLSRPKGTKKTEMVPLNKPLEIMSYEFGEPISLTIDGFFIETFLDDLPDEYEGQIHFDYVIPVNKDKK